MQLSAPSISKVTMSSKDDLMTGLSYCLPLMEEQEVAGKGLLNTELRAKESDLLFASTLMFCVISDI